MIEKKLAQEIEKRSLFSEYPYGFSKGKSTICAREKVMREIEEVKEEVVALITIHVKNVAS